MLLSITSFVKNYDRRPKNSFSSFAMITYYYVFFFFFQSLDLRKRRRTCRVSTIASSVSKPEIFGLDLNAPRHAHNSGFRRRIRRVRWESFESCAVFIQPSAQQWNGISRARWQWLRVEIDSVLNLPSLWLLSRSKTTNKQISSKTTPQWPSLPFAHLVLVVYT